MKKLVVLIFVVVLAWARESLVNKGDVSNSVPPETDFPQEVDRIVPFDTSIGDITPRDYQIIARRLGCTPALEIFNQGAKTFPVNGLVYGDHKRVFVTLAVKNDDEGAQGQQARTVLFLVAAGAPQTFLRRETMAALGCKDISPCRVMIHGYSMYAHVSGQSFKDVDILGTDYVSNIEATVFIDYGSKAVVIDSRYMMGYEEL